MQYWATSDLHLGHFNIIRYTNRPFKTWQEMNDTLIRNWNERVKPDDIIYHIGDFCFKNGLTGKSGEGVPIKSNEYIKKLNGKIIFLKGNHDNNNSLKTLNHRLVLKYGNIYFNLCHNPKDAIIEDSLYYPVNLVGHIHNLWDIKEITNKDKVSLLINVGVDVRKFRPISFDEIKTIYDRWLSNHSKRKEIRKWLLTQSQKNK